MTEAQEYKVVFGFDNGVMGTCDAVEYQGEIWLVPKWRLRPRTWWKLRAAAEAATAACPVGLNW